MSLWDQSARHFPASKPANNKKISVPTNICMGGNWYTFCSHFFLPANHRLEYFKDGFGGILPQHFATGNGTYATPLKAFNGLNKEEIDRYVNLSSCDYVVIDSDAATRLFDSLKEGIGSTTPSSTFKLMDSTTVLSPERSPNAIARSFYIPRYSTNKNVFKRYSLYKVVSLDKKK